MLCVWDSFDCLLHKAGQVRADEEVVLGGDFIRKCFETINEEELEHEFEGDGLNAPVNERGPDVPEPAKRLVQ